MFKMAFFFLAHPVDQLAVNNCQLYISNHNYLKRKENK